jgi:acyl-CoA synthetase (AMP-forming)/AMP-acid ligase II
MAVGAGGDLTMRVIGDLSRANARRYPDKIALIQDARTLTYRQLDERSNQFARALLSLGVSAGDRVALLAFNCMEYAVVTQGVAKAGATLVPLNFRLVPSELVHVLKDSKPTVIVGESSFGAALAQTFEQLEKPPRVILLDRQQGESALKEVTTLDELLAGQSIAPPPVQVNPAGPCVIVYTSGTTGRPKGVVLAHEVCFRMYMATAIDTGLTRHDIFLMAVPMFHSAGLNLMLHQALFLGATGVVHRGSFDPAAIFALIARHRISMTVLAPTNIGVMAQHPQRKNHDLSSWRKAFYGSMPMPPPVLAAAISEFPQVGFHQLYGSTESGMLTVLTWADHERHAHSTGREAVLSEVRIVDESGRDVAVGEIGEVLGRAGSGMMGYWRNEAATRDTIRDGWIHTGDRALRQPDGYMLVVGRIKEMIISGGENIYPAEVEGVLAAHPAVREVAVFGVPDPLYGESVCAAVSFRPQMQASVDELDRLCRSKLAGYKRPRRYEFMDTLPRNASDKVQKGELRARCIDSCAASRKS